MAKEDLFSRSDLVSLAGGEFLFRVYKKEGIIPSPVVPPLKGKKSTEAQWSSRSLRRFYTMLERDKQNRERIDLITETARRIINCTRQDPDGCMTFIHLIGVQILHTLKVPWAYQIRIAGTTPERSRGKK